MLRNKKILQDKSFTIMMVFTLFICTYFLISGIFIQVTLTYYIKWTIAILILGVLLALSLQYPSSAKIKKYTVTVIIFLILPLGWFSATSYASFSVGYIFILLMSICYFYEGKERAFYAGSTIIISTTLLTYQIISPESFLFYTKEQLIVNTIIQLPIIFSFAVYLLAKFTDTLKHNNQILNSLSTHDEITGIYNRRHIYTILNSLKNKSCENSPSLIGLIDIDHFKSINDTYGHDKGDKVIKAIASHIEGILGSNGIVGRYGGDEFIVIFKDCHRLSYVNIITQMCNLYNLNKEFSLKSTITISGGFVLYDGTVSIDDSLALADSRLYEAKESGKNQIIMS